MTKRKIVFVVVEGRSDNTAIGALFDELFNPDEVHVEIMYCDILTDYLFNNEIGHIQRNANIKIEIKKVVEGYLANNRSFKKSDIKEIIHICDTDGCFAPESVLVEDESIEDVEYYPNLIKVKNLSGYIKVRNYKQANINKLIDTSEIWSTIPYHLYYMSSSIDYVLYNKLNLTDDEKRREAHRFVKQYNDNWDKCIDFLISNKIFVVGSYKETWNYVKKDLNSLSRCTNIHLCFPNKK